jgi:hypothetical protein
MTGRGVPAACLAAASWCVPSERQIRTNVGGKDETDFRRIRRSWGHRRDVLRGLAGHLLRAGGLTKARPSGHLIFILPPEAIVDHSFVKRFAIQGQFPSTPGAVHRHGDRVKVTLAGVQGAAV